MGLLLVIGVLFSALAFGLELLIGKAAVVAIFLVIIFFLVRAQLR